MAARQVADDQRLWPLNTRFRFRLFSVRDQGYRTVCYRGVGGQVSADLQKRAAAARAIEFVRPGMKLGLGTGSTAKHFVELLGERVRAGLNVVGVPTS
jgi:hypothetical protein